MLCFKLIKPYFRFYSSIRKYSTIPLVQKNSLHLGLTLYDKIGNGNLPPGNNLHGNFPYWQFSAWQFSHWQFSVHGPYVQSESLTNFGIAILCIVETWLLESDTDVVFTALPEHSSLFHILQSGMGS